MTDISKMTRRLLIKAVREAREKLLVIFQARLVSMISKA